MTSSLRRRSGWSVLLLAISCGTGPLTGGDDGSSPDNGRLESAADLRSPIDLAEDKLCDCPSPEQALTSCVVVQVRRATDDASMPWKLWPDKADGVGTLIVSEVDDGSIGLQQQIPDADLRRADAVYRVGFCLGPGPHQIYAFLDDNRNATMTPSFPMAPYWSSDFIDSCHEGNARKIDVDVDIAQSRTTAGFVLDGSCD